MSPCRSLCACRFLVSARLLLVSVVVVRSRLLQWSFSPFSKVIFCSLRLGSGLKLRIPGRNHVFRSDIQHHTCGPDTDNAYKVATKSIVALLQPKKRHGTEMDVTGAQAAAVCTPTVSDPGASPPNGRRDPEERQAAVLENSSKRRK